MNKISFLIPTRNRPKILNRLIDSVIRNSSDLSNIEMILYIDEDDLSHHDIKPADDRLTIKKLIRPRANMGFCNSECLKHATGDIIILLNDDTVIQTTNWDIALLKALEKFPDQIFLAYPNDLFKKSKLATFPILSRKTCELLHDPFPHAYKGAFIETHLVDIFQRLKHHGHNRILYLNDIIFEHMHYRAKKAEFDQTYQHRDRFGDDFTFISLAKQRVAEADRLINYIAHKTIINNSQATDTMISTTPRNLLSMLALLYKTFIKDAGLPCKYKAYLFYYHSARFLAAKFL